MRKTTITAASFMHAERRQVKPKSKGRKKKLMACAKCGKSLKVGEPAYRTSRKYLCEDCGSKSEI